MSLNTELISDLRSMFKRGATPSRLIRYVIANHPGGNVTHWVIRDYLEAAFALFVGSNLSSNTDYDTRDFRYAVLNKTLLSEMLRQRKEWDNESEVATQSTELWLDGLTASAPEEANEVARQNRHYGLSEASWDSLPISEQEGLLVSWASSQIVSERADALARLAESLQQQVDELMRQLALCHEQHMSDRETLPEPGDSSSELINVK